MRTFKEYVAEGKKDVLDNFKFKTDKDAKEAGKNIGIAGTHKNGKFYLPGKDEKTLLLHLAKKGLLEAEKVFDGGVNELSTTVDVGDRFTISRGTRRVVKVAHKRDAEHLLSKGYDPETVLKDQAAFALKYHHLSATDFNKILAFMWKLSEGLDESVNPKDKKVVLAFIDKKAMDGKALYTDGKTLDGVWIGGRGIAAWNKNGKIEMEDKGSKAADSIQNFIKKNVAKNELA